MTEPLLKVRNLKKHFPIRKGFLNRVVGHVKATPSSVQLGTQSTASDIIAQAFRLLYVCLKLCFWCVYVMCDLIIDVIVLLM